MTLRRRTTVRRLPSLLFVAAGLCASFCAAGPNRATRRWWAHVEVLASDAMQGRDTGSEGYGRAARYVVEQFQRNGLTAAGDAGYEQPVLLQAVRLRTDDSAIALVRRDGVHPLQWLRQVVVPADTALPDRIDAGLVFVGSTRYAEELDVAGKILVQLSPARFLKEEPPPVLATVPAGAAGLLEIERAAGPEPRIWPVPYSVAMRLAGEQRDREPPSGPTFAFNPAFADLLFEGSGHTYQELLDRVARGMPLPNFAIPATLRATLRTESTDVESANLVARLAGRDPKMANEYVVVSAHLDGYGVGAPRDGDRIYNGAFDDAASVATLIGLAEHLHDAQVHLKRSLLFVVTTGEEKGLLGSRYFVEHPTVPKDRLVADINLDLLRPLFPLDVLTVLGLDESTLGDTAARVAASLHIGVQRDPEPERHLVRRSDQWSFMRAGVPAVAFVFGFRQGSPEERVYRRWYAERYHAPGDDLRQPWDADAAATFNEFFYRLTEAVAGNDDRPRWHDGAPVSR